MSSPNSAYSIVMASILASEPESAEDVPLDVTYEAGGFRWIDEKTPSFSSGFRRYHFHSGVHRLLDHRTRCHLAGLRRERRLARFWVRFRHRSTPSAAYLNGRMRTSFVYILNVLQNRSGPLAACHEREGTRPRHPATAVGEVRREPRTCAYSAHCNGDAVRPLHTGLW